MSGRFTFMNKGVDLELGDLKRMESIEWFDRGQEKVREGYLHISLYLREHLLYHLICILG